ncbi:MAG TPA: cation:proton antiporter [Polyangiaceae bacterium]|nr:cation:proton antiporter [Polyangiaceae bacterium]
MHSAHEFLKALTIVLGVAAITTVVFQRLHQPVVLGYIIAGLIIGPHVPIPLVADGEVVQTLSELGVILLMFSLGLEFSLRKLVEVGPTASVTAIIQCSAMIWAGFIAGRALGFTVLESLFTGSIAAISSTTIIAKAFDERDIRGRLRELVVGVLIVEDLIAILLMTTLTAVSTGSGLSPRAFALTTGRLGAFLAVLLVGGLLVVPRSIRAIARLERSETLLVASVGLCFGIALLAQEFGYSVALGAFIAGSLVAESGEAQKVERLVLPVRDIFGAIFFVSVGMMIDPKLIAQNWASVAVLTLVVVVGKIASVSLGAFLSGAGTRNSIEAGMSMAQIGEFSFIIAGLGMALGVTRAFLYPVAVAVSAITTLATPWLIRGAAPFAELVDRALPQSLQTFASLYGSWIEKLRSAPQVGTSGAKIRRLFRLLLVDASVLASIVIGASVGAPRARAYIARAFGAAEEVAQVIVIGGFLAIATPFGIGVLRLSRGLGLALAELALPEENGGKPDLARAPRRAFVVTLQVASALLIGAPLVAATQPFLSGLWTAVVLSVLLLGLGVGFWRSAEDLEGHVRASTQMIVEALAKQARAPAEHEGRLDLNAVRRALPGLGEPEPVELDPRSSAIGKTLAQLNLRGRTGATVLVITRGENGALVPSADEALRAGDILALAGTRDAVAAAREMLSLHAR